MVTEYLDRLVIYFKENKDLIYSASAATILSAAAIGLSGLTSGGISIVLIILGIISFIVALAAVIAMAYSLISDLFIKKEI
ncbi:MAG: hypothetical protein JZD41_03620 [Thermoproteus sp.]|nr:hypothetical protein [Thermoproteus sp.]